MKSLKRGCDFILLDGKGWVNTNNISLVNTSQLSLAYYADTLNMLLLTISAEFGIRPILDRPPS